MELFGFCGKEKKTCSDVSPITVFFPAMDSNSLLPLSARLNTRQNLMLMDSIPKNYPFPLLKTKQAQELVLFHSF